MSALYLGTGEKAQHLVNCVQQSLQSFRPRTLFLLDFCRGNRLIGDSSSVSMLRPLLQDFENSCAVSLYHTPDLRGIKSDYYQTNSMKRLDCSIANFMFLTTV